MVGSAAPNFILIAANINYRLEEPIMKTLYRVKE